MLASFLTGTANRIFIIALPTLAHFLGTDLLGISLALIAYQVSFTSFAIVFGRLGDLFGRLKVFGIGLLVFTISSLLCGLAQNIFQLVSFRLLQGLGAAMSQSQGRALAMDSTSGSAAGKGQGFMTTAYHSGFLFGPSIGGLLIDYLHWRAIFFFLVPIGTVGAMMTWMNMKRSPVSAGPTAPGKRPSIDYLGAVLLVVVTLSLITVLDRIVIELVGPGLRGVAVALFVISFLVFLLRESFASSPLLDLSLFKIRMFAFSASCLLVVSINHSMSSFLLPFYLQEILHLSPSFIGLLFMSAPVFTVTLSPVGGYIADKWGPRVPSTTGVVLFGTAALIGTLLRTDSHWLLATLLLGLQGLATSMFFPANHAAMIGSVPEGNRGVATGALYVMFGLGNIFGITLGNFLMTAGFRYYTGIDTVIPSSANPAAFVSALNIAYLTAVGMYICAAAGTIMRGNKSKKFRDSSLEFRGHPPTRI